MDDDNESRETGFLVPEEERNRYETVPVYVLKDDDDTGRGGKKDEARGEPAQKFDAEHLKIRINDEKLRELEEEAAKLIGNKEDELRREEEKLIALLEEKKAALRNQEKERLESKLKELESSTDELILQSRAGIEMERERLRREVEETNQLRLEEEEARSAGRGEEEEKIRIKLGELEALGSEASRVITQKEKELEKKEDELRLALEAEKARLRQEEEDELRRKLEELEDDTSSLMLQKEEEMQLSLEAEKARLRQEGELRLQEEFYRLAREQRAELDMSIEAEKARLRQEGEEFLREKLNELSRQNERELQASINAERERLGNENDEAARRELGEKLRQKEEELRKKEEDMRASLEQERARLEQESESQLKKKLDELSKQKEGEFKKREEELKRAFEEEKASLKLEGVDDRRSEMERAEADRGRQVMEKREEEEGKRHFFLKSMVGAPSSESLAAPMAVRDEVASKLLPFAGHGEKGRTGSTVGEILADEKRKAGLPVEGEEEEEEEKEPPAPAKVGFDRMLGRLFSHTSTMPRGEVYEISNKLENLFMNVERAQMELGLQRDTMKQAEEREGAVLERIGELRSLILQNESAIKERASAEEKLETMVKDVEPSRIASQLKKREEEAEGIQLKMEKLEKVDSDMIGRIKALQAKIEGLGDLDTLTSLLHDVDEKLRRIEKLKGDTERFSGKAESFYMESDKRFNELFGLKEKLVQLEELSNEITRTLDDTRLSLNSCARKEDLENLKIEFRRGVPMTRVSDDTMKREMGTVENELEELRRQVHLLTTTAELRKSVVALKEEETKGAGAPAQKEASMPAEKRKEAAGPSEERIEAGDREKQSLNARIAGIRSALLVLDERYRKGAISKKAYDEIKSVNDRLLNKLMARTDGGAAVSERPNDEGEQAKRTPNPRETGAVEREADPARTVASPSAEKKKGGDGEPARP